MSTDKITDTIDNAPISNVRLATCISETQLRAFLGTKAAQQRIREIVIARLGKNPSGTVVEELAQQANLDMLDAKWRPRSIETAMGWLSRLTACAAVNRFRREGTQAKWVDREVDVENLPPDPDLAQGPFAPDWLLTEWLAPRVAKDPRHQETYELLLYKARTAKTHAEVAADHGMTEGALKSRIRELKTTYEPQWKRRQRMFLWLLVIGTAVVVALIAWLLARYDGRHGVVPASQPVIDQILGNPLPVSHPPPFGDVEPDAGSRSPR